MTVLTLMLLVFALLFIVTGIMDGDSASPMWVKAALTLALFAVMYLMGQVIMATL